MAAAASTMITYYILRIVPKQNPTVDLNSTNSLVNLVEQYSEQLRNFYLSLIYNYISMLIIGVIAAIIMRSLIIKRQSEGSKILDNSQKS